MAVGVPLMKNVEPYEEELVAIEKNRRVFLSWLLPIWVALNKVNRHSNKPCVCLKCAQLFECSNYQAVSPSRSILQILIKVPSSTGKVGNPCAE